MAKKDWMLKETELDDDQQLFMQMALDKSFIVSGCAGSGKSVLALHKALQIQAKNGPRFKVIVYTKSLYRYMNAGRKQLNLPEGTFFYRLEWRWRREPKRYANGREYLVYSKDQNGDKIPYMPSADYIIVDEIQDFTKDEILEFVKAARKNFFFFGDTAQSVYRGKCPVAEIARILPPNIQVVSFNLYRNHRLPLPVARVVQSIGVGLGTFIEQSYKSQENARPRFIQYNDENDQIAAIHRIITDGNLEDVAILLPRNDDVKRVYDQLTGLGGSYELKYKDSDDWRNEQFSLDFTTTNPKVMTYHSAKGLQFEAVFLPLVERCSTQLEQDRKALYVAMTRTYRYLYVMYSGSLPQVLTKVDPKLYAKTENDRVEDI